MTAADARLEAVLAPLLDAVAGQYPRPWMTDAASPATARVFVVGRNQRHGYPVTAIPGKAAHLDALFNRGPIGCRALYERLTDSPSPTRRNLDRLAAALAARGVADVLQTNVVCFATPMSADLRRLPDGLARGRMIFTRLLDVVRPPVIIVHGRGAATELAALLGATLPAAPGDPEQTREAALPQGRVVVLPSLAPPAFARWSRWAEACFERVARHVAEVLDPVAAAGTARRA